MGRGRKVRKKQTDGKLEHKIMVIESKNSLKYLNDYSCLKNIAYSRNFRSIYSSDEKRKKHL